MIVLLLLECCRGGWEDEAEGGGAPKNAEALFMFFSARFVRVDPLLSSVGV